MMTDNDQTVRLLPHSQDTTVPVSVPLLRTQPRGRKCFQELKKTKKLLKNREKKKGCKL